MFSRRSKPLLTIGFLILLPLSLYGCATLDNHHNAAEESPALPLPELQVTEHTLDNGLTLLVHEDRKAPVVGVYVWYRVGSKDESPGRTGFAHLFEHLMFTGTEHYEGEYFAPLLEVGATGMNGTTSVDRTDYYQTVPTPALDRALWLESERMGFFINAVTQEKLDREIDVVKNEYRQMRDQPYGGMYDRMVQATYPQGHPYSWPTIGRLEDVEGATLDNVRDWFERYYGAANAVLVVAGDVSSDDVIARVERYFGGIRPGPDITRPVTDIARMREERRDVMQDNVPQARLMMVWNVPPGFSETTNRLQLAADALSSGRGSLLRKRLVEEEELATSVSAGIWEKKLGSQFIIDATAADGVTLQELEQAIDEILADFLRDGPEDAVLQRARVRQYASTVRGLQSVDGRGKSGLLARSLVMGGSPHAWREQMLSIGKASAEEVRAAAVEWLDAGRYVLEVHPRGSLRAGADTPDRAQMPAADEAPPALRLPALEHHTLSNGLPVALARQSDVPQVEFRLIVDAGYATDQPQLPGVASMAESLRTRGTNTHDAISLSEATDAIGAHLSASASRDHSVISLSAVWPFVDDSLALYADVIRNATFPEDEFERLRRRQLSSIAQEKSRPSGLISRVLPTLLYGADHPYAQPASGTGTEKALAAMQRDDFLRYQQQWLRPDNARLLVTGDIDAEQLLQLLERHLGDWQHDGAPPPQKTRLAVSPPERGQVFLIDRPGADQSFVVSARLAPPTGDDDDIGFDLVNQVLGGTFTARLNQRLRVDRGWSYGISSILSDALGPRPFYVYGAVQTDRTADSAALIHRTLQGIRSDEPPQPEEVDTAARSLTLTLPGQHQTLSQITGRIAHMLRLGLDEDHFDRYVPEINTTPAEALLQPAQRLLQPDAMTWLIIGDRAQVEAPLRALDLGPLTILDTDGVPLDMTP